VAPVSLFGGAYDKDAKMSELRDLFRMFFAERAKDGAVSEETLQRAGELRTAFGMGAKEADAIVADVTTKVYRIVLKKQLEEGVLAAASSPARALQALCDALRFAPPSAEAVNMELYRTKLEASMAGGVLSDGDEAELQSLRKLLCVPAAADKAARKEVCGDVFKKTLTIALGAGADGFSSQLKDKVLRAQAETRLDADTAVELLGDMAKKVFLAFVRDSRNKASRLDAAKELKNIVLFNASVVTPLVNALRGADAGAEAAAQAAQADELNALLAEAQAAAKEEDAATDTLRSEWAAKWTVACSAAGVAPLASLDAAVRRIDLLCAALDSAAQHGAIARRRAVPAGAADAVGGSASVELCGCRW
jgi:hypothetical protein